MSKLREFIDASRRTFVRSTTATSQPCNAKDDFKVNRFDSIDALRGIGAFLIVICHWPQLLVLQGTNYTESTANIDKALYPFYASLRPLYDHGGYLVDLFFIISGFIFFILYLESIQSGKMPSTKFSALRFSRLYPLHIATLFIVAILQLAFFSRTNQWMTGTNIDILHFGANLLFINIIEMSFNYPTWTITVEILMYGLFWIMARLGLLKGVTACIITIALGLALIRLSQHGLTPLGMIGRGLVGFFSGGLVFKFFKRLDQTGAGLRATVVTASTIAAIAGWATILTITSAPDYFSEVPYFSSHHLSARIVITLGLYPMTLLAMASWDRSSPAEKPVFAWLGQISYSCYLLHVPIILLIAVLSIYGFVSPDIGESASALLGLLVVLAVVSTLTYTYFEMPAQKWLRQSLASKSKAKPGAWRSLPYPKP